MANIKTDITILSPRPALAANSFMQPRAVPATLGMQEVNTCMPI